MMSWSHADPTTYRSRLRQAGLTIATQEFIPEGKSGHALFRAHRPPHLLSSSPEPRVRSDAPAPGRLGPAPHDPASAAAPHDAVGATGALESHPLAVRTRRPMPGCAIERWTDQGPLAMETPLEPRRS
jgi:hypothetical protein